jgi:hypothetical protein
MYCAFTEEIDGVVEPTDVHTPAPSLVFESMTAFQRTVRPVDVAGNETHQSVVGAVVQLVAWIQAGGSSFDM